MSIMPVGYKSGFFYNPIFVKTWWDKCQKQVEQLSLGKLSPIEAENLLKHDPTGTFLLRTSKELIDFNDSFGNEIFTLTYSYGDMYNKKFQHVMITIDLQEGYLRCQDYPPHTNYQHLLYKDIDEAIGDVLAKSPIPINNAYIRKRLDGAAKEITNIEMLFNN